MRADAHEVQREALSRGLQRGTSGKNKAGHCGRLQTNGSIEGLGVYFERLRKIPAAPTRPVPSKAKDVGSGTTSSGETPMYWLLPGSQIQFPVASSLTVTEPPDCANPSDWNSRCTLPSALR